ncbi:hypothetical protein T265_13926, partial [Opisthorchis viverrini]
MNSEENRVCSSTTNALPNQIRSRFSSVHAPRLCISDPMCVGKCGDADGVEEEVENCGRLLSAEESWPSSLHHNVANPLNFRLVARSRPDSKDKLHRSSDSYSKSPDPVFLPEPPKLRRGLAYLDFEDGDCEPDEYLYSPVNDCLLEEKMRGMMHEHKPGRLTNRFYSRTNRMSNPQISARYTDLGDDSDSTTDSFDEHADDGEKAGYAFENTLICDHLPSGDLFHQFAPYKSTKMPMLKHQVS